jgi:hypothetical protein
MKCRFCGNTVEAGEKHDREDCPYFECAAALITQMMIDTVAEEKERERRTGRTYPYPGNTRSGRWS